MDAINAHLVQQTPTSGFVYTAELRPERTATGACVCLGGAQFSGFKNFDQIMASCSEAGPSRVLPRRFTDAGRNDVGLARRTSLRTSPAWRTEPGRASRLAGGRGTHPDMHGDA